MGSVLCDHMCLHEINLKCDLRVETDSPPLHPPIPHVLVNLPLHEFHKQFRSVFKRLGTSLIKYMNRFSGLNKLTVR